MPNHSNERSARNTELKECEEKLRQIQAGLARAGRLTMLGELSGFIAHEVKQQFADVLTNAETALQWLGATPPNIEETRAAIHRITSDGNRACMVIAHIRALMRRGEPAREPLNLNELIRESVALTQPELTRKKVSLLAELAQELPHVPADRVQVQQVLINLLMNALDSLDSIQDRPRVLRIRTERPEADVVHVAVQDTGVGINPRESERLFEPFYTTKLQGLGMGLAVSRSIVEAHGGRLWATSNDDHGATFQFALPVGNGGAS